MEQTLHVATIREALRTTGVIGVRSLQVFGTIDSTNAELRRQARRGARPVTVCVADTQTHGTGRGGRSWLSPPGHNCYVSVLDEAARPPLLRGRTALWAGIALAEMLRRTGVEGVRLKWPNDLIWRGAKLGGILVEGVGTREGPVVVIGVGLNLWLPPGLREAAGRPVADLREVLGGAVPQTRAWWVARVIAATMEAARLARSADGAQLVRRWARWDGMAGVRIRLAGGRTGVASGIDGQGRLRVHTGDGVRHLTTLEHWGLDP
jgi:BirA family biotin operon repressor/biotin-[acetyl-CoA-carboxylase] ligase